MAFGDLFVFSRPNTAAYADGAGLVHVAAIDQPRFDHAGGAALGLLVETGGALGQADRATAVPGDWSTAPTATVVHEWSDGSGIRRDAHYTTRPRGMVNGCLGFAGHHRRIAVYPGYLRNYGGWVWVLGQRWSLPGLVSAGGGAVVSDGGHGALIGG